MPRRNDNKIKVVELFAGVGGFRIGLEGASDAYETIWNNQWEPSTIHQDASLVYRARFGSKGHYNKDINTIPTSEIPDHDLLVGGFPCQDYSVASTLSRSGGIEGKKGVLWWQIYRILEEKGKSRPHYIFFENVDRLLGSPAKQRGRDFAIILASLSDLGYTVEWRVINAADYGIPQLRERVIIVGFLSQARQEAFNFDFPIVPYNLKDILEPDGDIDASYYASEHILNKRREKTVGKDVFYPSVWHENKAGDISLHPYACALRTGASYNYQLINGVRRPTSRELLRFQGFPDTYKIVVSHQEIRRQTGNSVAVPMIRAIATEITNIVNNID